ncbi:MULTISPECIES: hypothetical protein [unclassified Pseudovibrio]|uniref:hypothetical protein n=1 Tax=unclassified Pseudovibrio TaxID=2627060 RepID=UPI0007AEE2C7|nr:MULTISPECIES: hypothetical protein [unclassified Pseudovibrio]KZK94719.1 hypothetical protein PsW74_04378 [Pseudovibrio sp. W74]KZL04721.1 hypothetical protein PsAD14_04958 [Pseudovibrio sp. Ad14]
MKPTPWEVNPQLSKDTIEAIAQAFKTVRGEVIDLHNEELGDTNLSLGVRCYECCRSRLIELSEAEAIEGLSILTHDKKFTFAINGVPVRFIRKSLDDLMPYGKLVPSEEAARQYEMFPDLALQSSISWFIVIEAFCMHAADKMYFAGHSKNGNIVSIWNIPLEDKTIRLDAVLDSPPEASQTPKVPIKLKKQITAVSVNDE